MKKLHYQIFIEAKGDYLAIDEWKEEEYIIQGLPFFNEQNSRRKLEDESNNILKKRV